MTSVYALKILKRVTIDCKEMRKALIWTWDVIIFDGCYACRADKDGLRM